VSYQDRTLTCSDCGAPFTFTSGEQEFYASKGFTNEPRRCPNCRLAKRASGGGGGGSYSSSYGGSREMFSATCASCGKEAKVPFQPRGDKPVYCSDCFRSQGGGSRSSYGGGRSGGYGDSGYGGGRGDRGGYGDRGSYGGRGSRY